MLSEDVGIVLFLFHILKTVFDPVFEVRINPLIDPEYGE